ncbi:MAG: hypothetical protein NZ934_03790, partial [Hadesarchaea archaeon]|nr:hypothetical protein [Hadesarchaea archaeon]
LQELTPFLWDAVDQTLDSVKIMSKLMSKIKPKPDVMRKRAQEGFAAATELADLLARRAGIAFRGAHAAVGRMIARAIVEGKSPDALTLDDLQTACREVLGVEVQLTEEEFKSALNVEKCIEVRPTTGGPAPRSVREQIKQLKRAAKTREKLRRARSKAIEKAEQKLLREVKRRYR